MRMRTEQFPSLELLQQMAWSGAELQGHHDNLRDIDHRLATIIRLGLIHTEVSEAMQLVKRQGVAPKDAIAEELADIIIFVAELAEDLDINLSPAVLEKLAKNLERPYKFGTPEEATP
jgi:NTP pyrophosphatase (non-canonical NTP hydrolase)